LRTFTTLVPVAAIVCLGAACITHSPVRTFDSVNTSQPAAACKVPPVSSQQGCAMDPLLPAQVVSRGVCTSSAALQADSLEGERDRLAVKCASWERHQPITTSSTSLPHKGFDLHVLEFDDEGLPWNRAQQAETFDVLERQLRAEPAVVVAFVHGWKNDASVCNGNLSCFRDVLEILAKGEIHFARPRQGGAATSPPVTPRRVIGVYIGWRGGTVRAKGLKQLTFWGRKHTAHVVGDNGAVTAVIDRLRTMVDKARRLQPRRNAFRTTSMIFIGHSFGAALLYSAVATSLNGKVGAAIQGATGLEAGPAAAEVAQRSLTNARPPVSDHSIEVETDGDLVILVNPAMEASRFANLNQTRNLKFKETQMPMFLTFGSEADGAVGGFFPLGQAFATLARSARSRDIWFSMEKGFGLYEPYHTHRLVEKPDAQIPQPERTSGTCRCTSNLAAFGDALILRLDPLYELLRNATTPPPDDALRMSGYQETMYTRLEPVRDVDPNNPFIMASVDPQVIGGHSDIFNARFMDFLIEYVIKNEIKRNKHGAYGPGLTDPAVRTGAEKTL